MSSCIKKRAWKRWAEALKANTYALYLAGRDPRVPLAARIIIAVVVAYALSPIDLIPDFIPVLGYLDDLLLVPAGIALAVRLIPQEVWRECKEKAANRSIEMPVSRLAVLVIVMIWMLAVAGFGILIFRLTA